MGVYLQCLKTLLKWENNIQNTKQILPSVYFLLIKTSPRRRGTVFLNLANHFTLSQVTQCHPTRQVKSPGKMKPCNLSNFTKPHRWLYTRNRFRFLHNTNSNEYARFRELVERLRSEKKPEIKDEDKYEPEFSMEDDDSYDAKPVKEDNSNRYLLFSFIAHGLTAA